MDRPVPQVVFPVRLVGNHVGLEEQSVADAEANAELFADPEVARYLAHPISNVEHVSEFLRAAEEEAHSDARRQYHLKVTLRSTGEMVGTVRIGITSTEHKRGDVGYAVRPSYWGQGIATEALSLLLAFGFNHLNLRRIEAIRHPGNLASGRVMEKAGMRLEGRLRDHRFAKGEWWDSIQYAILSTDSSIEA